MERKRNKQPKLHIKAGDTVKVIAGNAKGGEGRVMEVNFKTQRALVEGVKMVKKHMKPSASNPQGDIVEQEAPIHISNLMVVDPSTGEARRTKRVRDENGKLQRVFKEHTSKKEQDK